MSNEQNARDCKHGFLRRSCPHCDNAVLERALEIAVKHLDGNPEMVYHYIHQAEQELGVPSLIAE